MATITSIPRSSRSDLLNIWRNVTLDNVHSSMPDLSNRQLAIVMAVYLDNRNHTVRSLAAHLNVTKAVVTRALDSLTRMGLVARAADKTDKRSIIVIRTSTGIHFLQRFADRIHRQMSEFYPKQNDFAA